MNKTQGILAVSIIVIIVIGAVVLTKQDQPSYVTDITTEDIDQQEDGFTDTKSPLTEDSVTDSIETIDYATHVSSYGYKISYPQNWSVEEISPLSAGAINSFTLSPIEPPTNLNELIVISAYLLDTEDAMSVYEETASGLVLKDPDSSLGETWYELNGSQGIRGTGFEGATSYWFLGKAYVYKILVNDTLMEKYDIDPAEAEAVVRTFTLAN